LPPPGPAPAAAFIVRAVSGRRYMYPPLPVLMILVAAVVVGFSGGGRRNGSYSLGEILTGEQGGIELAGIAGSAARVVGMSGSAPRLRSFQQFSLFLLRSLCFACLPACAHGSDAIVYCGGGFSFLGRFISPIDGLCCPENSTAHSASHKIVFIFMFLEQLEHIPII
jgi:hypothetical protein